MSASSATLTFEQMMALFHETREQMKESRKEFDRRMKETDRRMAETDRKFQETREELDRRFRETDKKISDLGSRMGELVAAMVEGGILRMFKKLGLEFDICTPHRPFGNKEIGFGEVDLLLENGEFALLVEVKTNLSVKDVEKHRERLKMFRLWSDAHNDTRRFLAAIGGGVVRESVWKFALKQGMFVVQQSGENVEIIPPKGKPKVW